MTFLEWVAVFIFVVMFCVTWESTTKMKALSRQKKEKPKRYITCEKGSKHYFRRWEFDEDKGWNIRECGVCGFVQVVKDQAERDIHND